MRKALKDPYDGSYRVIEHGSKTFRVDLGGRFDIVSVDRLKTAYVMEENEPTLLEETGGGGVLGITSLCANA
ncbi:hypothetical protein HZS_4113 [Henneguya salminicola]|nr:hypothetical protein HZS_4113 [Henneguya salminicola]